MNNNTVLLRVQLSEEDTEKRLAQLVTDLETTKKAQTDLTKARNADKISADEYAQQSVALGANLRGLRGEQTALTKNLDLYRSAVNGVEGSYDQLQAQLTLAQRQYRGLAGSADDSTEATQALSAVVRDLRGQLKQTDASSLDQFFRSVGDYPKPQSLEPLIQQIVRLEELQKAGILTAEQAGEVDRVQAGFKQQYAQAAAAQGKSLDQATNELKAYGAAIRPTVADLVKLESEQRKVAASTGQESTAYAEIGFKIGAARKELAALPPATELAASTSEKASKKLGEIGGTIENLDNKTGAFGGTVGELKNKFNQAKAGVEAAKVGFTGLKGAIAATGIGVLLLALGALYSYLTRTQDGLDFVERKTKAVGIVFDVLVGKASELGKILLSAFTSPKQALADLYDILSNAPAKTKELGDQLAAAAKAGEAIAAENQRIRDSERAVNVERAQSKKDIEALKLIAEDVTKSTTERAAATQKAAALEQVSINKQLQLQRDRIANMEREAKLSNQLTEDNDALAEARVKLAELEEGSLTRQIELNNKLNELRQLGLDKALADQKAYYERLAVEAEKGSRAELNARVKALQADQAAQLAAVGLTENQRRLIVSNSEQAIKTLRREFAYTTLQQVEALEQLALDRQLLRVQAGSQEELGLLRRKLEVQRDTELAAAGLTVRAKQVIQEKYLLDVGKLEGESYKARALGAYQAEIDAVGAELTLAQKNSQQETELKVEAINADLARQLASLDKRADSEARAALLRANAEKAANEVRYGASQASLEKYLQGERNALDESFARGKIKEDAYNKAILTSDITTAAARLQLAKTFRQDGAAFEQQLTAAKIASIKSVTEAERAEQMKRVALAEQITGGLVALFQDTVETTGSSLDDFFQKSFLLVIDSVGKVIISEQIKVIAQAFASAESLATFGAAGFAKAFTIIAATTALTAGLKSQLTPPAKQFAYGTVLGGASHANGGVQLYSRSGYHFGEAEANEVVLTKGVWENPLLRPLASQLNVLGGGAPLMPRAHLALGGIAAPLVRQQLRGDVQQPIDYDKWAQALKKVNIITRLSDIETAQKGAAYTKSQSSGFGG